MSTQDEISALAVEHLACDRCGAGPGFRCVSSSGRVVEPHAARWYTARERFFEAVPGRGYVRKALRRVGS